MTTILAAIKSNSSVILNVLLAFFAPISGIVLLVALSTIIDTVFGLWKAYNLKENITSRKARFGLVPKIISYCAAICLIYACDFYMINDLTKMVVSAEFLTTKLLALVLISIEVKSIDESFQSVKGWSFIDKITDMVIKAKNIKKEL
jgi:peptidoglycan biosynthesis protein MviN/MurJ (putative lipid II flippase)